MDLQEPRQAFTSGVHMNKKALIIAAVAATLTSGAALAQHYDNRDYRTDRSEQNYRGDRYEHNYRGERGDYSQRDYYSSDRRYDRDYRHDNHYRGARRDYRYDHGSHYRVRRGEYLAHHYRGSRYVVTDWRQRRLYAPPRGYHWVQAGNDYALVALATGLIAQVLLNN
jgi:Ni/Co efflux regulator RcnB